MTVAIERIETDVQSVFEAWLAQQGYVSRNTIRTYSIALRMWLAWCEQNGVTPKQARLADVIAFRDWMLAQGRRTATVRLRLTVLKAIYRQLVAAGICTINPFDGVRVAVRESRIIPPNRFLTEDELRRLFAAVKGESLRAWRDRAILALLALHGVRQGELRGANVSDFDAEKGYVLVAGKGSARLVWLREDVVFTISRYLDLRAEVFGPPAPDEPLFLSQWRRRFSTRCLRALVRRYFNRAGIRRPGVSAHSLRHTAATLALAHGADPRAIQEMLGHRDPKTTQRYAAYVKHASPASHIPVQV